MTTTNPTEVPGRTRCFYSVPNGVPYAEQRQIDRLHVAAGSFAWTYEQYLAEQAQLDLPPRDRAHWQRSRLAGLSGLRASFEAAEREIVRDARGEGVSWADIAGHLGISRQAAQKRFGGVK